MVFKLRYLGPVSMQIQTEINGSYCTLEKLWNLKARLNEHNPSSKKCKNSDVSDHLQ